MADTIVDLRMSRRGLIKLGGAAAVATTGAAGAMWPIEAQLKELEHQGWSRPSARLLHVRRLLRPRGHEEDRRADL